MEDNNAQNLPVYCANGCGFYGNPMNNNLCSKCFKEWSQKNGIAPASSSQPTTSSTTNGPAPAPSALTEKPTAQPSPAVTQPAVVEPSTSSTSVSAPSPAPATPTATPSTPKLADPSSSTSSSTVSTPVSQTPSETGSTEKPPQVNKGRCYMCRAKIPLAKQAINKCRCEFIFCDAHKATNKHDCDFDFAKMGKDQLAKNNPKLNDKPRGGRSFTRMDS